LQLFTLHELPHKAIGANPSIVRLRATSGWVLDGCGPGTGSQNDTAKRNAANISNHLPLVAWLPRAGSRRAA